MADLICPFLELPAHATVGLWNLTQTLPSKAREELIDQVLTYANDCELAPTEFYAAMKQQLERRKVPELDLREIQHSEAGFASARRLYLRLGREKIYFDVCAAPFGAAFFFSYRAVVKAPLPLWLRILIVLLGIAAGSMAVGALLNLIMFLNYVLMIVPALAVLTFVITLVRMLQRSAETYYKFDTRAMFVAQTKEAFEESVHRVTHAKGVKLTWRAMHPNDLRRGGKELV